MEKERSEKPKGALSRATKRQVLSILGKPDFALNNARYPRLALGGRKGGTRNLFEVGFEVGNQDHIGRDAFSRFFKSENSRMEGGGANTFWDHAVSTRCLVRARRIASETRNRSILISHMKALSVPFQMGDRVVQSRWRSG